MPMNKAHYPSFWPEITRAIKETVDYHCQGCGIQCYRPGEPVTDHRKVLTVHHRNHDPRDCRFDNLIAFCTPCHLRADALHHARNARRTRARRSGQLFLPDMEFIESTERR